MPGRSRSSRSRSSRSRSRRVTRTRRRPTVRSGARPSLSSVRSAVEKSVRIVSVQDALKAWRTSPLRKLQPKPADRKYRVASHAAVLLYLKWSQIDRQRYVAEHFDCDDFACALRGEAVLRLKLTSVAEVRDYSGGHAYTAILVHEPDGTLKWIVVETQSDRIIEKRMGTGQYKAAKGEVIF